MELEKELKELKAKKELLKYMGLFGLKEQVRNIISPMDEKPLITFSPKTKEEYLNIITLLKNDVLDIYKESRGCTGFNPITKYDVIKETDSIKLLNSPYLIDTKTNTYSTGEHEIKIKFFIPYQNKVLDIWLDVPLNIFSKNTYDIREIVDTHETQNARQYNQRHKDIYTHIPEFKGVETIHFYGGHYTHYATTKEEQKQIKKLVFLKLK